MVNLAKEFANQGLKVDMVVNVAEGPYLSSVPSGVRVVDLDARRVAHTLLRLVCYLRCERPTAVLSTVTPHNLLVIIARDLARCRARTVVREANMLSKQIENARNRRYALSARLLVRFLYRRADAVVSLSQGVADDLVTFAFVPRERIETIYNPVDVKGIQSRATEPVEHPWLGTNEVPVAIAVGRLIKQKDYPTLIQAFSKVRRSRPLRLIILGQGEERGRIAALIEAMGLGDDVAMLGFVENPYSHVARSNVFVLSSAWEGLGTAIVEALAVGTPVVSTDCPSGPAEILENGKYGWLVPVGDATSLAGAIVDALDRPPAANLLKRRALDFALGARADEFLQLLLGAC
jgi:glycosyltransferase involved in cell wall biosynthesis